MNCPFMWANNIDEEDDQTSSWESEPEGENAEELASLETHDEEGEWCWPEKGRVIRWGRRIDSYLAEEDEDEQVSRTEPLGPTKRWRSSVDVEEGHRGGRLRSTRECDAEEHVSRKRHQTNIVVQERKRVQRTVRTPEGFVRKSTWQVADVRRPLVSASHIIQAGNDLFIGKDEAYFMNRKKREKSMLRKDGHVYVLNLFVRVPPNVTVPVTYTPMEVDAINQVADGGERGRRVTFDCKSPTF